MREIRMSGSEGGGAGNSTGPPYPYYAHAPSGLLTWAASIHTDKPTRDGPSRAYSLLDLLADSHPRLIAVCLAHLRQGFIRR